MSADADNVLADVDLDAWGPPAPPPPPIEDVLWRYRAEAEGTRMDAAAALDPERVEEAMAPARPPVSRTKWLAIGIVIGCVAASLVAIASVRIARSVSDDPSKAPAPPAPTAERRPAAPAPAPAGSALDVRQCVELRDKGQWFELDKCATELLRRAPDDTHARGLKEQAQREAANQLRSADLELAVKRNDPQAVITEFAKIAPDSVYYERARKLHDDMRRVYIDAQVTWGRVRARAGDCAAIATRAAEVGKLWEEAATALRMIDCSPSRTTSRRPQCRGDADCTAPDVCKAGRCIVPPRGSTCDAVSLLEEAKVAFGENKWARVLRKAEESNSCAPSRFSRGLALRAACRLMNKAKAMKYWKEFQNDPSARQACVGVVDAPPF